MFTARPVQIPESLLEQLRRRGLQPRMVALGLSEFGALRHVIHPRPAPTVFPALFEGGVPHSTADITELLALFGLFSRQLKPVPATRKHRSNTPFQVM
nr:hypothetical protein [Streptomyces inhibens]